MSRFLALCALLPAHLATAQECTFGDVAYTRQSNFVDPINDNPPTSYRTLAQNAHSSRDCSQLTADLGYHGRICTGCGNPTGHKEFQGGFVVRAASETDFGRELVVARADLLDVGFVDGEGNRVEEKTMDWTPFPELDCTCEGESVTEEEGTCPSPLVCATSSPVEYGSLSVTQTSSTVGNIASIETNVSLVHETLAGTAFFAVAVPIPFKEYEEENGSILLKQEGVRILFDKKCGENEVTVASLVETEPPKGQDVMMMRAVFPHHNLITFHLSGDNATCDWSYSIELELEDASGGGASLAASASLAVALAAALLL